VDWGPRKILDVLGKRQPDVEWPATSTVAAILKRNGLGRRAPTAAREGHPGPLPGNRRRPMKSGGWTFKGQFRTRDRRYCFPFTVTDLASATCCVAMVTWIRGEEVRTSLERVFRQHGMRRRFAATTGRRLLDGDRAADAAGGLAGLARDHEAAHRAGAAGAERQAERNAPNAQEGHDATAGGEPAPQQELFASFQREFNEERPHEGLGMRRLRRFTDPHRVHTPRPPPPTNTRPLRGPPGQSPTVG